MPPKKRISVNFGKRGRPAMPGSALGNYIQGELNARGWTQQDLAARSGVSESTIRRIINGEDPKKMESLYDLSQALDVSFGHLLTLAGYKLDAVPNDVAQMQRLAALRATFPWLEGATDNLTRLTPEQLEAALAILEVMARRREEGA